MREDKAVKRQQQGIAGSNPDSVKPAKTLIIDKYKNIIELNKIKR